MTSKEIAFRLKRSRYSVQKRVQTLDILKADQHIYSINHEFFRSWNNEMAYILGFIFADGCIQEFTVYGSQYRRLTFASKDYELLKDMNNAMKSNYPIYGDGDITGKPFYLYIARMDMVDDLMNLGVIPRKSLTMQFPDVPD